MVKECLSIKEFIQQIISTDADSATHSLTVKMHKTATGVNFEEVVYVIRMYHSQQAFPMSEKQFLNQDHHKVQDSKVKPL